MHQCCFAGHNFRSQREERALADLERGVIAFVPDPALNLRDRPVESAIVASGEGMDLSEAARELLLEVSRDPAGLILRLTALGGTAFLKTNGRAFGDGSPEEQARWANGVRQLLGVGLIEPQGDRVFCITPEGYQAADVLQRSK